MVIGGTAGVVGSRRNDVRTRIAAALARRSSVTVALTARRSGQGVEPAYTTAGTPDVFAVHLALVQREAASQVERGENGGRTLRHAHVARAFADRGTPAGHVDFPLPAGLEPDDVFAAACVQRGAAGEMYAATTVEIG